MPHLKETRVIKRITWFESLPGYSDRIMSLAVSGCCGTFPSHDISQHGNARKTNQEYIRTSKTKQLIQKDLKSNKPVNEIFR